MSPREPSGAAGEPEAVAERYARRAAAGLDARYDPLRPDVMLARHARERALAALLARHAAEIDKPRAQWDVLEVGCGTGDQLLALLQLGFAPQRLAGNELLPARLAAARERLPSAVTLWPGDATQLPLAPGSLDLVLQFTVFSSLLDDAFQQRLAAAMWRWLRPGGAVLWYDFTWNNPRNADVRGVAMSRVRELFPGARISDRRVTLAPPLARALCRLHPAMYGWADTLPLLRTHRLAWIARPRA